MYHIIIFKNTIKMAFTPRGALFLCVDSTVLKLKGKLGEINFKFNGFSNVYRKNILTTRCKVLSKFNNAQFMFHSLKSKNSNMQKCNKICKVHFGLYQTL